MSVTQEVEHVLVVPTELFRDVGYFQGFNTDTEPYLKTLLDPATADGAVGFNDLTTDHAGRIYVGSLAFKVFGGEPMKPATNLLAGLL